MEQTLYRRVAEDIKAAIASGTYEAGARLPSESELAQRYGASRGTIRQAFAALRADGVISSRQGARRVVLGGPRVQSFAELLSFSRWARAIGEVPAGRVVTMELRAATEEERVHLELGEGARVYHLTRLRLLSGRPVMIERSAYREPVGAMVAGMELDTVSITERLQALGVIFADAEHLIDAVAATTQDARLLDIRPRTPLLRERRRTTDPSGVALEWSDDRYIGDAVAFSVHNSAQASALSRLPSIPRPTPAEA
ncbi:GntR family transcriptional regulator [Kutzneria viridogrisea]|uniref:GntR family transcription regulator n=2 Tax=Kutzneria TaxID=43356 RepID=W5W893_9PSEU|nr:GntR family transcriptional regulator [Kutzneria albida]AHH96746.1 GntR family transcription regulator [Kutzneria albida DSM 43870]MBA8928035.1 GntR family transcriptional regulator [Kutzneria viridogrisea]